MKKTTDRKENFFEFFLKREKIFEKKIHTMGERIYKRNIEHAAKSKARTL